MGRGQPWTGACPRGLQRYPLAPSCPHSPPARSPALCRRSERPAPSACRLGLSSHGQPSIPPAWTNSRSQNPGTRSHAGPPGNRGKSAGPRARLEPTFHSLAPWQANSGGKRRLGPWLGEARGQLSSRPWRAGEGPSGVGSEPSARTPSATCWMPASPAPATGDRNHGPKITATPGGLCFLDPLT